MTCRDVGAGDENQTRTVSLGSLSHDRRLRADTLACGNSARLTVSYRESPSGFTQSGT